MVESSPKYISLADQVRTSRDQVAQQAELQEQSKMFAPQIINEIQSLFATHIPRDPSIKTDAELASMPMQERAMWAIRRGEARLSPQNSYLSFEMSLLDEQKPSAIEIRTFGRTVHENKRYQVEIEELDHVMSIRGEEVSMVSKKWTLSPGHELVIGGYNPSSPDWRRQATVEEMQEYLDLLKKVPQNASKIEAYQADF